MLDEEMYEDMVILKEPIFDLDEMIYWEQDLEYYFSEEAN